MKILISVLSLFFLTSFKSSAQSSGKITYEIKAINFEPKKDAKQNELIDLSISTAKSQTFTLLFSDLKSSFTSNSGKMEEDMKEKMLNQLALLMFTCDFDYFLDISLSIELFKKEDGALIKNEYKKKEWKITSESKKIDSYLCYKATYSYTYLGRDNKTKERIITAWFAPSLPYSYGPKNYNGLPGLILELQDWDTTFLATKIELFDKEIEIDLPKGKTITQEEYERKVLSGN
ncbi:GLPGLI family protein [Flavobacterium dankookense]|uniref:GLPGLI family protein n=1 Tax=Flavobacterium dankookense TaxID=706186 RepID=A0A4R6QJP7_9FLAO|nr:GLPGLI family protein [Flavobacterium dankookense]TDP61935.1 GLPGLI family protein [Flavobacterium dankookense]